MKRSGAIICLICMIGYITLFVLYFDVMLIISSIIATALVITFVDRRKYERYGV
jgi:hypothetical protein